MKVHLINPSDSSFGTSVITPRWLYVLASATPAELGDPNIVDETLARLDPDTIHAGDVVGIGIHTGNALRGYEVGKIAREHGAKVVFGGIHATLFPEEAHQLGAAHSVVKGDGDQIWATVVNDCLYAIGGEGNDADPRGVFELNEVYNPRTDAWTRLAPLPVPIHGLNGVPVVNGDLYIAGGASARGVSGANVSQRLQVFHTDLACN